MKEQQEMSEEGREDQSRWQEFVCHIRDDVRKELSLRSDIGFLPQCVVRILQVNYFFIVPAVSTLGILMLIFVPLHRYPWKPVFSLSFTLLIMANLCCLVTVALWRWWVERHYQEIIERKRLEAIKSGKRMLARFASPFLTPDGAHPVRYILGLMTKDNLLYILPTVTVIAVFPADIRMLDPVMDGGISSIFSYIVLFWVMANILTSCVFIFTEIVRFIAGILRKIAGIISGSSYSNYR